MYSQHSIYDLLPFDKEFYLTFIESGIVFGDEIEYRTKFGVRFTTNGNKRKMADFLGHRYVDDNGDTEIITKTYQVVGTSLQYIKKKTG